MRKKVLGIDLGTVNSYVAIPGDEGKVEDILLIKDHVGRAQIPSVVYKSTEGDTVVGYRAKQKMGMRPSPVAFIKRFMGKAHKVELGDEQLTPEEISAKILRYLATLAKEQLGEEINQAVITIPARFGLPGQQATIEAARMAGLEVLTTLPEPVAAALAYGLQHAEDNIKIFCYDLGGGTFDATVMTKDAEKGITVLSFDGDPQLGGFNFDTALAKWILTELQSKYSLDLDWEAPKDKLIFQKLMYIAEQAKLELSNELEVAIHRENVFEDHNGEPVIIDLFLTRKKLEEMLAPFIEDTLTISMRAIKRAKLTPEDIDRVIMVGGSSRIPMIKELLAKKLFCMPQIVNPDTIVAEGAAIKAGSLVGSVVEGITLPNSLNFVTQDISLMLPTGLTTIFKEGSPIPAETTLTLKTLNDNESFLMFDLYNGSQNIGEVRLEDIPAGLPVGSEILLNMSISDDLVVSGTSTLMKTNQSVPFSFRIPKPELPDLKELRIKFDTLKEEFQEAIEMITDNMNKMQQFNNGQKQIDLIEKELESQLCDQVKIYRLLDEFQTFMVKLTQITILNPSWDEFDDLLTEARDNARSAEEKSEKGKKARFMETIDGIEQFGRQAYQSKNKKAWTLANQQIKKCWDDIMGIIFKKYIRQLKPEQIAEYHLQYVQKTIEDTYNLLQEKLKTKDKAHFVKFKPELNQLIIRLNEINLLQPQQAMRDLKEIQAKVEKLKNGMYLSGGLMSGTGEMRHFSRTTSPITSFTNEVPGGRVDRVQFSVTSPPVVLLGTSFVIDVWAHLERQRSQIIQRVREAYGKDNIHIKSKGPVHVSQGTILYVRLKITDLIVEDPEDTILWEGDIGNATFPVTVPNNIQHGSKLGCVLVYVEGLEIGKIHFNILVDKASSNVESLPVSEERHRKAFASYANADRNAVMARIQGILKAAPLLDVFLDVLSLRSGQNWEQELQKVIPSSDVFYLFWSRNAKASRWVEKEWRCALEKRGVDFIDPVPLVSPEEVPPPPELATKHFNDWVLAFMRSERSAR